MPNHKNYEYVVKNPDTTLDYKLKNIIAGFPGVGKSMAAKTKDWMFLDMESSDYHWIASGDGNKICNPNWPNNYIDAILEAARNTSKTHIYILISTHNEVLAELDRRGIYYTAVLPRSKDIYIQRYADRGNDAAFIQKLKENFETFIKSVESTKVFGIYYTDDFLLNIFAPDVDVEANNVYPPIITANTSAAQMAYHEFYPENFPMNYTNKYIVAVADPSMVTTGSIISYDKYLKSIETDEENTPSRYIDFIVQIACSNLLVDPFVYIPADPALLEELYNREMNYLLVIPKTYVPKFHTTISSKYGNSQEAFDHYIAYLKSFAFRVMITDYTVNHVFIHGSALVDNATSRIAVLYFDDKYGINKEFKKISIGDYRDTLKNTLDEFESEWMSVTSESTEE